VDKRKNKKIARIRRVSQVEFLRGLFWVFARIICGGNRIRGEGTPAANFCLDIKDFGDQDRNKSPLACFFRLRIWDTLRRQLPEELRHAAFDQ
jgi:hypothetical protein